MLIPPTTSRSIARLLVGVMMFAQMAVAAYACTGALGLTSVDASRSVMEFGLASPAITGKTDGVADHGTMDRAQPNLCAAHCQSGQQNAAGKPAPEVPVAMAVSLYPQAPVLVPIGTPRVSAALGHPPPLADPPHAILHCCYRI
ncbi:MAG: hypothetical protein ABIR94_01420 [Rubrivivax sp.]